MSNHTKKISFGGKTSDWGCGPLPHLELPLGHRSQRLTLPVFLVKISPAAADTGASCRCVMGSVNDGDHPCRMMCRAACMSACLSAHCTSVNDVCPSTWPDIRPSRARINNETLLTLRPSPVPIHRTFCCQGTFALQYLLDPARRLFPQISASRLLYTLAPLLSHQSLGNSHRPRTTTDG